MIYKFLNHKHQMKFVKFYENSRYIFEDYNAIMIVDANRIKVKNENIFRIIFEATFGLQGVKKSTFKNMLNLLGRKELV